MMAVQKTCPRCKKTYQLGVDGAHNWERRPHQDECDQCSGVRRDNRGYAWGKHERVHHYDNGDGTTEKVSRRQAFRR